MADDGVCPGPCNNPWRRAWARYQAAVAAYEKQVAELAGRRLGHDIPERPEPPALQPWGGEPVWCPPCKSVILADLSDLDDLGSALAALPPGIRPAVEWAPERVKVTMSKTPPSPSPSADTLDELEQWLRSWEVYAKGDDRAPRRGLLSTARHAMVNALVDNFPVLINNGQVAEEFGSGVRTWRRALAAAVHAGRDAKHVKQPCPGCRKYTMWERPGDTYVVCHNPACQARPTREELKAG